ncbi:hypothetical protein LI078_06435 [Stenotrophomonas maltophilia]|nr:hypothetical protein [Stenotrophomonas geniculata]MBN5087892.1 hypothetical protein [Stenotrophomonas maltophilia]MCB7146198.1 hypothetical protein [Stenotrophomonas maltophilia]
MTQSEWATWTQAGLTVGTFAFAMWRQKVASDNAAKEKAESNEELRAERQKSALERKTAADLLQQEKTANAATRARAIAVSMRIEMTGFLSVVSTIHLRDNLKSPATTFAEYGAHLGIRHRAMDALDLGDAIHPVLDVISGAQTVYGYLATCRAQETFEENDYKFFESCSESLMPLAKAAEKAIESLIRRE